MKIIGIIPTSYDNGYILEAKREELANLIGYKYSQSKIAEMLKVGNEILISAMFDRLYIMANKEKELMEISAKLKAAADFVDMALPCIKVISKTGEVKE